MLKLWLRNFFGRKNKRQRQGRRLRSVRKRSWWTSVMCLIFQ